MCQCLLKFRFYFFLVYKFASTVEWADSTNPENKICKSCANVPGALANDCGEGKYNHGSCKTCSTDGT